jgi:hypothetical protein
MRPLGPLPLSAENKLTQHSSFDRNFVSEVSGNRPTRGYQANAAGKLNNGAGAGV